MKKKRILYIVEAMGRVFLHILLILQMNWSILMICILLINDKLYFKVMFG